MTRWSSAVRAVTWSMTAGGAAMHTWGMAAPSVWMKSTSAKQSISTDEKRLVLTLRVAKPVVSMAVSAICLMAW